MARDPIREAGTRAIEDLHLDAQGDSESLAEEAAHTDVSAWDRSSMLRRHGSRIHAETLNKRSARMETLAAGGFTKDQLGAGVIADSVDEAQSRVLARMAQEADTKARVNTVEHVQLAFEHSNNLNAALEYIDRLEAEKRRHPVDSGLRYFDARLARKLLREVYGAGPSEPLKATARKRAW